MNNDSVLDKRISLIGWSLLLIWWGLRLSLLISLPEGSGLLGSSLIFFGANFYRMATGRPSYRWNTFIGLFSLLAGGILFVCSVLGTPFQPPVFETMLITLGVLLLGYGLVGSSAAAARGSG